MLSLKASHPGVALAALALRRGAVTPGDVRRAFAEQAHEVESGKASRAIGLILLAQGSLTEETLKDLLAASEDSGVPESDAHETGGRRIGRYLLVRELGRGTSAITYEAHDTQLGHRLALKVFDRHRAAASHQEEERFVREARLLASIPPHPHLVAVYDAGIEDGNRYIAMELIRGRTFDLWRGMGAPPGKSIALLRDIGRAIHHAHNHGILHRDLKPANILVDAESAPHVMDFGLAKDFQHREVTLTSAHSVVGTPCYMSPEQAQGSRNVDRRTDVYSLGVMLYEVLAGCLPFRGKTVVETLLKTIQEPVRAPSVITRSGPPMAVDRAIERICLRALAKNPGDRHPTAAAFAEDLDRWLSGAPKGTRTLLAGVARWIRSRISGSPVLPAGTDQPH